MNHNLTHVVVISQHCRLPLHRLGFRSTHVDPSYLDGAWCGKWNSQHQSFETGTPESSTRCFFSGEVSLCSCDAGFQGFEPGDMISFLAHTQGWSYSKLVSNSQNGCLKDFDRLLNDDVGVSRGEHWFPDMPCGHTYKLQVAWHCDYETRSWKWVPPRATRKANKAGFLERL